ncbi:DUF2892 domain-containing protein [Foetidibacter luteolus]|uniref:DUF2892 domain-containing protein n=1 Tax=Foetidibacter luteolus TaxID=2608880 RepID=UPI001A9A1101|nr:DUF2892 domain-containing protein [Foetidibacter luteolus]
MVSALITEEDRIRKNTSDESNLRIDKAIYQAIDNYRGKTAGEIRKRLKKLDKEWDIERVLMLNASVLALTGTLLAAKKNKKWFALPAIVTSFLAQHAIQGWCPPLPLFRKFGVRTAHEIDAEKYALLELLERKGELKIY